MLALIVDDQESMRVMLRSFLQANGFRVLTAPTGRHALRICARIKVPIDVMITDVQMPEMSGFDLAVKGGVKGNQCGGRKGNHPALR